MFGYIHRRGYMNRRRRRVPWSFAGGKNLRTESVPGETHALTYSRPRHNAHPPSRRAHGRLSTRLSVRPHS